MYNNVYIKIKNKRMQWYMHVSAIGYYCYTKTISALGIYLVTPET